MQLIRLLVIFLLYSFSMHAMKKSMDLVPTNLTNYIHIIPDEILSTTICSWLDRSARDTFRCTSTKYCKLVFSQDELNEHYAKDERNKIYWKNMGGMLPHQEFANAIKNKKKLLATWLLAKKKVTEKDAYCENIQEAVRTSTVNEMLPVIKWLLHTLKPAWNDVAFVSGYEYAKCLAIVNEDSGAQRFFKLLYEYKDEAIKDSMRASFHGLDWL